MSFGYEWTEWHLTPTGWLRGSLQRDTLQPKEADSPINRVLTCKWTEKQSSPFSEMIKRSETTWECEDRMKIEELKRKFGDCPNEL